MFGLRPEIKREQISDEICQITEKVTQADRDKDRKKWATLPGFSRQMFHVSFATKAGVAANIYQAIRGAVPANLSKKPSLLSR